MAQVLQEAGHGAVRGTSLLLEAEQSVQRQESQGRQGGKAAGQRNSCSLDKGNVEVLQACTARQTMLISGTADFVNLAFLVPTVMTRHACKYPPCLYELFCTALRR